MGRCDCFGLFLHLLPDFPEHRLLELAFDAVSPQVIGAVGNVAVLTHLELVLAQQYVAAYASVVTFTDCIWA